MSCYMVSTTHIDAMLTAGIRLPGPFGPMTWLDREIPEGEVSGLYVGLQQALTEATAGRVGAMLLAENRRSVNHRYAESEIEQPYVFHPLDGMPDPVIALKAIAGYQYQSNEHPGWMASEARRFCEALRYVCVWALPGMDDSPGWAIRDSDRRIFLTHERQV